MLGRRERGSFLIAQERLARAPALLANCDPGGESMAELSVVKECVIGESG